MAASILRLRAAAAAGGFRRFLSSAACLMLPSSNKMYSLGEKKVVNIEKGVSLSESNTNTSVVGSSHGWVGLSLMKEDERSLSVWNPMSGSRMKLPPVPDISKLVVDGEECSRAIVTGSSSNWLGVCCPGRSREWTRFGHNYAQYEDVVAYSQSRVYSLNCLKLMARWNVSDPRKPRMEWEKYLGDIGYDDDLEEKNNFPRKPDHLWCYKITHLVHAEHSAQIFIVTRHYASGMDPHEEDLWNFYINPMKTVAFDVHLLVENENEDEGKSAAAAGKLRYMEHSLDGLVMFVGVNNSFAVAAADFPHLNPDSIYFTDHHSSRITINGIDHIDSDSNSNSIYGGGHDTGIYDYKCRTISSCYYPTHHHRFKRIHPHPPPYWFTPSHSHQQR